MKFLVVDDHALIRDAIRGVLKELRGDALILEAASSEQAMDAMRQHPDLALVLLDLKLPKIGGLEILQRIKSDPRLKTIPVVVLTSSNEEKDVMKSYSLGVNAYVVKPVDFHQFVNAVKELGIFWAVINEPPPGSVRNK